MRVRREKASSTRNDNVRNSSIRDDSDDDIKSQHNKMALVNGGVDDVLEEQEKWQRPRAACRVGVDMNVVTWFTTHLRRL